jgi:pilus assembly protein CpaE
VAHGLANKFNATTILIDADVGFGTASLQFDFSPARTLDDAIKEGEALDKEVLERLVHWRDRRFGIIAAPARLDEAIIPDREQIRRVVEQARRVARYVVLDVPQGWGPLASEALTLADTVTLVATPDLVALRNTRTLMQMLKVLRPNDPAPTLILNQKPTRGKSFVTADEFSATLSCPLTAEISSDPEALSAAQMAGKILLEHAPKSQVSNQILALTAKLALHSVPRAGEKSVRKGVLSKLFRRKAPANG